MRERLPTPVARLVQCLVEEAEAAPETLTEALQLVALFARGCQTEDDWRALSRGPYGEELLHQSWLFYTRTPSSETLPAGAPVTYEAGQYVNVILDGGNRRSYSFTVPGGTTELVELHVRRMQEGKFTTHVFEHMRVGDLVRFEGPLGTFVLREPSGRPLIFVAGATGFAPVKSLLEEAFRQGIDRPLHFYWGVRKRRDLYMAELPQRWQAEHPNFRFVPVLSEPGPEDDWTGRTGLVHEAILADFPDLSGYSIYACGSVKMVETARPAFVEHGLSEDACYSDAFVPAAPAQPANTA